LPHPVDHPCSGLYYAVLLSILLSVSPSIWVKVKVAQAQLIFELAISYCRREVWFAKMLQREFSYYAQQLDASAGIPAMDSELIAVLHGAVSRR